MDNKSEWGKGEARHLPTKSKIQKRIRKEDEDVSSLVVRELIYF